MAGLHEYQSKLGNGQWAMGNKNGSFPTCLVAYLPICLGLLWFGLLYSTCEAQRLRAWNISTDSGTSFQILNGTNADSFKWAQLRGQQNVPPRTVRHARALNMQVVDGGDPFGRVVLLWSGWAGSGGDRTEYWIRNGYKVPPIYEGVRLGAAWEGTDLFRIRMWNEQWFTWQPRAVVTSVYAENAPLPTLIIPPSPAWTDLSAFDLDPSRPGIQIDALDIPTLTLDWQTETVTGRRSPLTGLKRIVSLDNYSDETRPSPFRDDLSLTASVSLRVGNGNSTNLWSVNPTVSWAPLEVTLDQHIANQTGSVSLDLTAYPLGTTLSLTYEVKTSRTPYDENGQVISPPVRDAVDDLRDGEDIVLDLKGLTYTYSGAISGGGSVSDEDAPPACVPKQAGTLDITFNLQDFGLPFDLPVTLAGVKLDPDTVRWSLDVRPNLCINIGEINVLVKRVWGQLTAEVQRVPLFYDAICNQYYNVRLIPEGGDSGNWLNAELYALCQEFSFTRVNVETRQINYEGFGGGVSDTGDPRLLSRQVLSQVLELVRVGDTNGDGCVNDRDVSAVLFDFGRTGDGLETDLNHDGRVDGADLVIALSKFGRGCP